MEGDKKVQYVEMKANATVDLLGLMKDRMNRVNQANQVNQNKMKSLHEDFMKRLRQQ